MGPSLACFLGTLEPPWPLLGQFPLDLAWLITPHPPTPDFFFLLQEALCLLNWAWEPTESSTFLTYRIFSSSSPHPTPIQILVRMQVFLFWVRLLSTPPSTPSELFIANFIYHIRQTQVGFCCVSFVVVNPISLSLTLLDEGGLVFVCPRGRNWAQGRGLELCV